MMASERAAEIRELVRTPFWRSVCDVAYAVLEKYSFVVVPPVAALIRANTTGRPFASRLNVVVPSTVDVARVIGEITDACRAIDVDVHTKRGHRHTSVVAGRDADVVTFSTAVELPPASRVDVRFGSEARPMMVALDGGAGDRSLVAAAAVLEQAICMAAASPRVTMGFRQVAAGLGTGSKLDALLSPPRVNTLVVALFLFELLAFIREGAGGPPGGGAP